MSDFKELKEHIRWLEDERLDATAVDECLDQIDNRLEAIDGRLDELVNAFNSIASAINQHSDVLNKVVEAVNRHSDGLKELLKALTTPRPPPSTPTLDSVLGMFNEQTARPKLKPREPKLSVVPKNGDDGPGAAP